MPRTSPYRIELTDDERARLEVLARCYSSPHQDVVRAKIVLLAAGGLSNEEIAVRLDIPARSSPSGASVSTSSACQGFGTDRGPDVPRPFLRRWSWRSRRWRASFPIRAAFRSRAGTAPALARAAVERGIVPSISGTTVWRWLSAEAIRPWFKSRARLVG